MLLVCACTCLFKGVADVCVCSHNEFGYVFSFTNHSHQLVLFVVTLFYNCVSNMMSVAISYHFLK